MATMNVSLPDAMKDWVDSQTKTGHYGNASDYIRDLIRRDHQRKDAISTLQLAIREGLESGMAEPFDTESFLLRMHEKHIVK